jgi:hypothetical protein
MRNSVKLIGFLFTFVYPYLKLPEMNLSSKVNPTGLKRTLSVVALILLIFTMIHAFLKY